MKARIIKESVDSQKRKAISELGKIIRGYSEPLIVVMKPRSPMLSIHGSDPLSKYINEDKIPQGFETIRLESRINSGVVFTDESSTIVRIFADRNELVTIRNAFFSAIKEVFASKGVEIKESSHRPDPNDLIFEKDGKEKKFCGTTWDIIQSYFSFMFSLNFAADKIDGLYKLDSQKFVSRGANVEKISDVVCGIDEILPNADDSIVDEILNLMASKLGWDLEISEFNRFEQQLINK